MGFEEQIKSKDKYPSISSHYMEGIVLSILQIFFRTCAVFKIVKKYHLNIYSPGLGAANQSHDAFRPITRERQYFMDYNMRSSY